MKQLKESKLTDCMKFFVKIYGDNLSESESVVDYFSDEKSAKEWIKEVFNK